MSGIAVGITHDAHLDADFVVSLVRLQQAYPMPVIFQKGPIGRLDVARNRVFSQFLKSDRDWLLMLDTDMVFTPSDFAELAKEANDPNALIVSGLYYQADIESGSMRPMLFDFNGDHIVQRTHVTSGSHIQHPDLTGFGFCMIHRKVLEAFGSEPWCDNTRQGPGGQAMSEDFSFFCRAGQLGFRPNVVTTIQPGHIKPMVLYGG